MYMQTMDNNFRVCCLVCPHPDIYIVDSEPSRVSCKLMQGCERMARAEEYDKLHGITQRERVYPPASWFRKRMSS